MEITLYAPKHAIGISVDECTLKPCQEMVSFFKERGFTNVTLKKVDDVTFSQEGKVESVFINGINNFIATDKFDLDSPIVVSYYTAERAISLTFSAEDLKKDEYIHVVEMLKTLGFTNVKAEGLGDLTLGWFNKENAVDSVSINGDVEKAYCFLLMQELKVRLTA